MPTHRRGLASQERAKTSGGGATTKRKEAVCRTGLQARLCASMRRVGRVSRPVLRLHAACRTGLQARRSSLTSGARGDWIGREIWKNGKVQNPRFKRQIPPVRRSRRAAQSSFGDWELNLAGRKRAWRPALRKETGLETRPGEESGPGDPPWGRKRAWRPALRKETGLETRPTIGVGGDISEKDRHNRQIFPNPPIRF